ncbi:Protein CASPARIAN STRIP INTEGRITY FACTOR 1 [Quillaja saponaria]|uniref:Protein CASPARIAN STRIP INTEGRITY FACTOR 1 n=1 Tax=Quillaja saponaria TaxID=32244 RepID=A0AAD7M221_QUISA|nr:Protein CASPARIAN STRIP INTEGRITY FACTOR 1 [Quillaja saponaria]
MREKTYIDLKRESIKLDRDIMDLMLLIKKYSLLFLLISGSLLSTFFADRKSKFVDELAGDVKATQEQERISMKALHDEEASSIHERLLKMNTKDYGRYDPAPALVKPPFKLIPN